MTDAEILAAVQAAHIEQARQDPKLRPGLAHLVPDWGEDDLQCKGVTSKGDRCSRTLDAPGFCRQHKGQA